MNYVLHGEKMAANFTNSDEVTTTSDTGAVIPNTILNKIVEKMEKTGDILNKVTMNLLQRWCDSPYFGCETCCNMDY